MQVDNQQVIAKANFIPVGNPTFIPATDAPCDGVAEVRQPAVIESVQSQLAKRQQEMLALSAKSPARFGRIDVSAKRYDSVNNGKWELMVTTAPFKLDTTLYDVHVQVVMKSAGKRARLVQLSNRELFVHLENRYALLNELGSEAVVCFTARDPARPQPLRMTKWFAIETRHVTWLNGGGRPVQGETASFVPSREPTLTPASEAPCQ
jgi:hypothetical protein